MKAVGRADLPLSDRSLLAVFAHPDDESVACGGMLAWCAAVGVRVSLLCLTHGEHGPGSDSSPGAPLETLRDTRVRELRAAAAALGVADVVVLDYEDGMLPWVDARRLEDDIRQAIRRAAPDVVITFDEDGLYWHPDHIAVHERTTAAVAWLGGRAPALYYASMPPGAMRAVVQHATMTAAARGEALDRELAPILGVADPDAFGSLAPPPTLVVDAGQFARHKLAAIACHGTQVTGSALALVGAEDAPRLLGIEHYRRAAVGATGATFVERFAVAGPEAPSPPRSPSDASRPCARR